VEWLTVADVSEQAGIPPETVRRYITRHSLHLQVKKGHKSYQIAESCVPVFIQIRTHYAEGKQVDEVEAALIKSGRPTIVSVNETGESVTVNVVEALAALDSKMNAIAAMLVNVDERLKSGELDRANMNEDVAVLREQFVNVHKEVAATTDQLTERIADVQSSLGDEIRKGQQETSAQLGEILSRVETHGKQRRGFLGWFR